MQIKSASCFSRPWFVVLTLVLHCSVVWGQNQSAEQTRDQALRQADAQAFEENMATFDSAVRPFLDRYCVGCHGPKKLEGDLALDLLDPDMKQSVSGARWAVVRERLATGEMPPEDSPRPEADEIEQVIAWIKSEMKRARRNFTRRVQSIHGNDIDHKPLFDAKQSFALDVPPGLRRHSAEIYDAFRREQAKGFETLVGNPLTPDPRYPFGDMGRPLLDVPTTSQLLRNALTIVERQTGYKMEGGQIKPLAGAKKEFLEFMDPEKPFGTEQIHRAITMQFQRTLGRSPSDQQLERFSKLMEKNVREAGRVAGVRYSLAAVFLIPRAIFRYEVGGPPDSEGRARLTSDEISHALAYALADRRPPAWLLQSAAGGDLDTRQGVVEAIDKLLADPKYDTPRILRFFREFFEYPKALQVFKDPGDFRHHNAKVLVSDTDNLVRWILKRDRDVLKELLTTNRSFVNTRYDASKKQIVRYEARGAVHRSYSLPPDWKWTSNQPVEMPAQTRAGILTQPSWLVAWSINQDNHAILRGKWVRERLLGNVVPDIPITVDAQLPEDPERTLRSRMSVTQEAYCWQCHKLMNDVGLPFETYDHFGRWRAQELGQPVDASGGIALTGDEIIDGTKTDGAVEFVHRLAKSERVEQVFVRHVFRFFTGRNENLGDSQSLRNALAAYRTSGGSFRVLVREILASDSFLYRTVGEHQTIQ